MQPRSSPTRGAISTLAISAREFLRQRSTRRFACQSILEIAAHLATLAPKLLQVAQQQYVDLSHPSPRAIVCDHEGRPGLGCRREHDSVGRAELIARADLRRTQQNRTRYGHKLEVGKMQQRELDLVGGVLQAFPQGRDEQLEEEQFRSDGG